MVVFENNPVDQESSTYIPLQPQWQRAWLEEMVNELLKSGRITHPDAQKTEDGKWSLWFRKDGEVAVFHVCYLARSDEAIVSDFARDLMNPDANKSAKPVSPSKHLVVLNPHYTGPNGQAGEYYTIDHYAQMMDNIRRDVFLETISEIQNGKRSKNYTVNSDGTIAIHIHVSGGPYAINIVCTATWK